MSNFQSDNFVDNFISTCQDLAEFNLSNEDVCYLKKYLTNVNKGWISLSKEIIYDDFGYSNNKNIITDFFTKVLCVKYVLGKDYREDNTGKNKYVITNECYMKVLFRNKQDLFNKIRDLYVKTDGIIKMNKMKQNTSNFIELAKYIARTECDFSDTELNYIEKFWDPIFNESWIYLSKEIVCEDFGYKLTKDMMSIFYNKCLYKHFKIEIDYKEFVKADINSLDPRVERDYPVHGGQNREEYLITPKCYKRILMFVKTEKGEEIRDYYSKIEELSIKTYKIIGVIKDRLYEEQLSLSLQQLSIKDNELSIKDNELSIKEQELFVERSRNLKLSEFVNNYKQLVKEEVIYINTTLNYAKNNRFKVGGISNNSLIKSRLCTYNTGKAKDDLHFYTYMRNVNSYRVIEDQLKAYLPMFLEAKNKELYHIHYEELVLILDTIIDNIDKGISYINDNHERIIQRTIHEQFIPKNLYENELSIEYYSNGRSKISKIDISQLTDNEVEEKIREFIQTFKQDKLNITNDQKIDIKWSDFAKYLETKCKIKRSILKKSLDKYLANTNVTMIYR